MRCGHCEGQVTDFMAEQFEIGRLNQSLCFSCYLDSDVTAYDYSSYQPTQNNDSQEKKVTDALSQKLTVKIELLLEDYEGEGFVLFALTRDDAESLIEAITGSPLGHFISDSKVLPLRGLYTDGYQKMCWQAANWKYSPHQLSSRSGPASISIIDGIPCIADAYGYLQDEAENEILQRLLEQFLDSENIDKIDTLQEARAVAHSRYPLISELGLSVSRRVETHFRHNADQLSSHFRELPVETPDNSCYEPTSLSELKRLHDTQVDDAGTAKDEIRQLLEAAEGAPSKDIAEVVDCSISYARRFKYDREVERAVEKDWSQSSQQEKISPGTRDRIIRRDGACLRCESTEQLTVHHIVPVGSGGESNDENLAILCQSCHKEAHGGSFYPPTTVYDGHDGFESWIETCDL